MYIATSEHGNHFINTDMIASIALGKAPPDSDIFLTLSSGEVFIIKDKASKNKLVQLLNLA